MTTVYEVVLNEANYVVGEYTKEIIRRLFFHNREAADDCNKDWAKQCKEYTSKRRASYPKYSVDVWTHDCWDHHDAVILDFE